MELLFKALAVALIAGLISVMLERSEPVFAMLVSLSAVICILLFGTVLFAPVKSFLDKLQQVGEISATFTEPVLKCLGAALVTRFGAELCKDAKQMGAASAIELIGSLAALYAALPLFEMFLSTLEGMI